MATPRIFVSHSHTDNDWCAQFVDTLTLAGFDVWFDKQGLYVGDQWISKLETELEGRDVFLIVLTPNAWASPWVRREFELALHRNKRILGVKHKPVELTGFITTLQILDAVGQDAQPVARQIGAALRTVPASGESSIAPAPAPTTREPPLEPRTDGVYVYLGADDQLDASYCLYFHDNGVVEIANVRPSINVFKDLASFYAAWSTYPVDTRTWSINRGNLDFDQILETKQFLAFWGTFRAFGSLLDLAIEGPSLFEEEDTLVVHPAKRVQMHHGRVALAYHEGVSSPPIS